MSTINIWKKLRNSLTSTKEEIIPLEEEEKIKEIDPITEKRLDDIIENFFPDTGEWKPYCFDRPNDVTKMYLPCHLRDPRWLAELIKYEEAPDIDFFVILSYIKTSKFFESKRHNYELEIVRWQINWMAEVKWLAKYLSRGNEDLLFKDAAYSSLSPEYDIIFRDILKQTLEAIGLDSEVIEEGIETFSDLWLYKTMCGSYINTIMRLNDIKYLDYKYRSDWLDLRCYEYYKKHKESIDAYSLHQAFNVISEEDAKRIRKELKKAKQYIGFDDNL